MITADALKKTFPLCAAPDDWVKSLAPAMEKYAINNPARIASFLAQTGHESSQFNRLVEGLNYKTALRSPRSGLSAFLMKLARNLM